MSTPANNESYEDYFQGDDNFGVPEELAEFIEAIWRGNTYGLSDLLQASLLGVQLAETHKDKRRYIANCLRYLYFELPGNNTDGDLYQIRFYRLVSQIESELSELRKPDELITGKSVEQHWVTLKWLVEDQQKIIS